MGVVEGVHVGPVRQRDRPEQEERDPDQRVRGHTSHCGEGADLARELLSLADRVGDHVEQRRERAADLALNRHGRDRELEVVGSDPLGHLRQRVVHRAAQRRLGEHALDLPVGRGVAFVDHGLQALLERVARLQRRGDRDQQVRQLVLEGADALAHLQPDDRERNRARDEHSGEHERHRGADCEREHEEADDRDDLDPEELDRLQRHICALEHLADPAPLLQMAECLLGRTEDALERRRAAFPAGLPGRDLRLADVHRDPAAHP